MNRKLRHRNRKGKKSEHVYFFLFQLPMWEVFARYLRLLGYPEARSPAGSLSSEPLLVPTSCKPTKDVSGWTSSSSDCTRGSSLCSLATSSSCSHSASWLAAWMVVGGARVEGLFKDSEEQDSGSGPVGVDDGYFTE